MPLFRRALPQRSLAVAWLLVFLAGLWPGRAAAQPVPPELTRRAYLPLVGRPYRCPASSTAQYASLRFEGSQTDRPAAQHADLNLSLRGYSGVTVPLQLVDYDGDTDHNAPQIPGMFRDGRLPSFTAAWQVYAWDWSCPPDGCAGPPLAEWPATLLEMGTALGEPLSIPARSDEVYGGGYVALVLYAEERRITLKYTREDNVVSGYTVHLESLCVDPNLLALYRTLDAAGRPRLPALRNGEIIGTAGQQVAVAVRDNGRFMDPRSRKDWWAKYYVQSDELLGSGAAGAESLDDSEVLGDGREGARRQESERGVEAPANSTRSSPKPAESDQAPAEELP